MFQMSCMPCVQTGCACFCRSLRSARSLRVKRTSFMKRWDFMKGHHLCILPDASRSKIRSKCHITNTLSLFCKNSAYKNVTVCVNVQRRRDTLSQGLWIVTMMLSCTNFFYSSSFLFFLDSVKKLFLLELCPWHFLILVLYYYWHLLGNKSKVM